MKKHPYSIFISIIILFFMNFSLVASENIEVTSQTSFYYVHMDFQKNWDYVPIAKDALLDECKKQGLQPDGLFHIIFNEKPPTWGIGFKIDNKTEVKSPLKISKYGYTKIARIILKEFDVNLYNTVKQLLTYVRDKDYFGIGTIDYILA